jgi:hypothetical protein
MIEAARSIVGHWSKFRTSGATKEACLASAGGGAYSYRRCISSRARCFLPRFRFACCARCWRGATARRSDGTGIFHLPDHRSSRVRARMAVVAPGFTGQSAVAGLPDGAVIFRGALPLAVRTGNYRGRCAGASFAHRPTCFGHGGGNCAHAAAHSNGAFRAGLRRSGLHADRGTQPVHSHDHARVRHPVPVPGSFLPKIVRSYPGAAHRSRQSAVLQFRGQEPQCPAG